MKVNLCEKCGSCPEVVTVEGGVKIGEDENLVRLRPEEWNTLVEKIKKGKLEKI